MKKHLKSLGLSIGLMLSLMCGQAAAVSIFVDAAPNKYGSPDYAAWEAAAFTAAADGSFINMANSSDPAYAGSTDFTIEDEVVYSFSDLGSRLTWIYWIPQITVAEIEAAGSLQVSLLNEWDGSASDFYLDYYGDTWLTPGSIMDFNGGVIGSAGMAYWGANGVNTQEALDADIAEWGSVSESWQFRVRYEDEIYSLTSNRAAVVSEPTALALLAGGLLMLRLRRK